MTGVKKDPVDAQKVILSPSSPLFQKILKSNLHNPPLLYLRGTLKKDIELLLDFMYSGETQVPQNELENFMSLAAGLEVKGLVRGPYVTGSGLDQAGCELYMRNIFENIHYQIDVENLMVAKRK